MCIVRRFTYVSRRLVRCPAENEQLLISKRVRLGCLKGLGTGSAWNIGNLYSIIVSVWIGGGILGWWWIWQGWGATARRVAISTVLVALG